MYAKYQRRYVGGPASSRTHRINKQPLCQRAEENRSAPITTANAGVILGQTFSTEYSDCGGLVAPRPRVAQSVSGATKFQVYINRLCASLGYDHTGPHTQVPSSSSSSSSKRTPLTPGRDREIISTSHRRHRATLGRSRHGLEVFQLVFWPSFRPQDSGAV